LLAGCVPAPVETSSLNYLSSQQSHAIVSGDVHAAAQDVMHALGERGFNVVDQHAESDGGLTLRFRGLRQEVTAGNRYGVYTVAVGSEFVATLHPEPGGTTDVELSGHPLLDGTQPKVPPNSGAGLVSGANEAEVVHGVFSELAATGKAVATRGTAVQSPEQAKAEYNDCMAARHDAFARAQAISDLDVRTKLLQSAPECALAD
jgi:hypothetical protein